MAAPSQDVFQYEFPEPFPLVLTNGAVCAVVNPNIRFEFERDTGGDPHWYTAYELVNGVRAARLFRVAFEDDGSGGVTPTV